MQKPPLELTIHEFIQRLTVVMEKKTLEEREQFKKSWLDAVPRFDAETRRMQQEREDVRVLVDCSDSRRSAL